MAIYERMTNKQLKGVVADYATAFPGWSLFQGTAFVREYCPIQQMVWFEALRTGAYRPNHGVSALALPIVRMLPRMLDVRHREAKLGQHQFRRPGIVAAMEQQFKPDIRKPLDIAEVLALCEAEGRETTNDLTMLAILYALLDRREQALSSCARMQSTPLLTLAPIPEWEEEMMAFGCSLANAVEVGTAREFLEAAARSASRREVST
jgi:hypothetical protein